MRLTYFPATIKLLFRWKYLIQSSLSSHENTHLFWWHTFITLCALCIRIYLNATLTLEPYCTFRWFQSSTSDLLLGDFCKSYFGTLRMLSTYVNIILLNISLMLLPKLKFVRDKSNKAKHSYLGAYRTRGPHINTNISAS